MWKQADIMPTTCVLLISSVEWSFPVVYVFDNWLEGWEHLKKELGGVDPITLLATTSGEVRKWNYRPSKSLVFFYKGRKYRFHASNSVLETLKKDPMFKKKK